MPEEATDLIVVGDLHYIHRAQHECAIPARRSELALNLLRKVLFTAERSIKADGIVILGDLVDNGNAPDAGKDLKEIRDELAGAGLPFFALPGNHDGDLGAFEEIFGPTSGMKQCGKATLYFFVDVYGDGDRCLRAEGERRRFRNLAQDADAPLIVFQHNPVYPDIPGEYPYNLTNSEQVMQDYTRERVLLSVSAHYHPGIEPERKDGVLYTVCPALCEHPFQFLHIHIAGEKVVVKIMKLATGDRPRPADDTRD